MLGKGINKKETSLQINSNKFLYRRRLFKNQRGWRVRRSDQRTKGRKTRSTKDHILGNSKFNT